jgi:hypothetical protein
MSNGSAHRAWYKKAFNVTYFKEGEIELIYGRKLLRTYA